MNNVVELFLSAAERRPERAAVEVFRRTGLDTYTYRDVRRGADAAARLLAAAGCGAGTRCALLADNDARWCSTYLGILRLGAVAVPLDTSYKVDQVRTVLADSGARVLRSVLRRRQIRGGRAFSQCPQLSRGSGADIG